MASSLPRLLHTLAVAATLLLAGCVPPFFYPQLDTTRFDTAFVLPPPNQGPWLRLDNGLDLYAWQNCYAYVLRREPCDGLSLVAVPSGQAIDWMRQLQGQNPPALVTDQRVDVQRTLSAHSQTQDRLVGLFRRYEGSPAKGAEILLVRRDNSDAQQLAARGLAPVALRRADIWHDMSASGAQTGDIQLVVFDQQHMWIFAQPLGQPDRAELYAPAQLFAFDGEASELLQRPMLLYYDDGVSYGRARRVVADAAAAARGYRIVFAAMPLPTARFQLDRQRFQRTVVREQTPSVLCHYSETEFHASLLNASQRRLPELKSCAPFTEAALRAIERQRPH